MLIKGFGEKARQPFAFDDLVSGSFRLTIAENNDVVQTSVTVWNTLPAKGIAAVHNAGADVATCPSFKFDVLQWDSTAWLQSKYHDAIAKTLEPMFGAARVERWRELQPFPALRENADAIMTEHRVDYLNEFGVGQRLIIYEPGEAGECESHVEKLVDWFNHDKVNISRLESPTEMPNAAVFGKTEAQLQTELTKRRTRLENNPELLRVHNEIYEPIIARHSAGSYLDVDHYFLSNTGYVFADGRLYFGDIGDALGQAEFFLKLEGAPEAMSSCNSQVKQHMEEFSGSGHPFKVGYFFESTASRQGFLA